MNRQLSAWKKGLTYIIFVAMAMAMGTTASAQTWSMVNGDTVHIDGCAYGGGTIYDNGGPTGNYSDGFNGWVVIEATQGGSITLTGSYNTESCCDYISVWDGNTTSGTLVVNALRGSGSINTSASSGRMTIYFHTDGSVTYSGFALTWSVENANSTASGSVSNLAASAIGATTATLTWQTTLPSLVLDYGQGPQTVSGNTTTLTGLNPNTIYDIRLYAAGEEESACNVAHTSFRTACGLMAAPVVERFDDLTVDEMPPCWSMGKNFDDESLFPRVTAAAGHSGTQSLMLSSGNNTTATHFGIVMGPRMSTPVSTLNVHVSLRSNMANARVEIGVCDTTSGMYSYYGFTPIDTLVIAQSGQWYDYTVPMTTYSGDGCRLAFRMMQGMQPGSGCIVYIDDLMAEDCGVNNLRVDNLASDGMRLMWSTVGTPTVNLKATGGGTTLTFNNVTSPYTISGLEAATQYVLTLTPSCGGAIGQPKSLSVSTLSGDTLSMPYCQDFESGWPGNWYRPETYSSEPQRVNSSGYCMRMYHYNANENTVALPRLTVTPSDVSMTLRMRPQVGGSGVVVGVMNYPNEISSFIPVDTLVNSGTDYQTFQVHLSGYSGTGRYLALRSYSPTSSSQYIYVDDIKVGRCLMEDVIATNIGAHSVELRWNRVDENFHSDSIIIEYGAPGFGDGEGERMAVAARGTTVQTAGDKQKVAITGLQAGATYEFRLHGLCDNTTPDCGMTTLTVQLLTQDLTLPFCIDFEDYAYDAYPTGWYRPRMYDNLPRIYNNGYPKHSGSKALYFRSYRTLEDHSTAVLPMLDVNDMNGLILSFWAWNEASDGQTIEIGIMDDPNDESTFTTVATTSPAYNVWSRHNVLLTGYNGTGRYIAIRFYNNYYWSSAGLWIDDLTVDNGAIGESSVYSVRHNGATLEWNTVGTVGSVTLRIIHGSDTVTVQNVGSPYNLSGLLPGEEYRYELDWNQCLPESGTFRTRSEAFGADWCYDFESEYNNGRYDAFTYPVVRATANGTVYRGNGAMYLQSYNNERTAAVLPYLEEDDYTGLHFSFMAKGNGANRTVVGLMSDPRDTSTIYGIDTLDITDDVWRHYDYDLTGLEAQGHHLVLMSYSAQNSWTSYTDVDDLRIDRGNRITARSYTSTATTADIVWTATQATDSVRIVLMHEGATVFDSIAAAVDGGCHIEGLTNQTTYQLYLEPLVTGQSAGCDLDGISLQTLDHDVADGYCERAEGNWNILPEGWTWLADGGRQPWNDGYSWRFERNAMALHADSRADAYTMVISPRASLPLSDFVVGLGAWYNSEEATQAGYIVVGVIADPTDATTFTPLDTFYLTNFIQHFAVDLSAYNGTGRHLAFKGMALDGYDRNVWLTDITLSHCLPTRLRTTEVTSTGFNLRWDIVGTTDSVRIVIEGLRDTTVAATPGLCHFDGLSPANAYTISVIGTCQQQDRPCQWQQTQVTLLPDPITIPTCIPMTGAYGSQRTFDHYLPTGWTRPYGNYFTRYSDYDYRNCIEFYAHNCNNTNDMTSMVVSPYIPQGFAGSYLDFYLRNDNRNNYLVVGSMTDPYDTTTFIPHDTLGYHYAFTHISIDLAAYAGNYLAFRYFANACNSGYAYLSSPSLMRCPLPEAWLSHQEDTSVWVHWNTSDPVWIEYQMGGDFTPGQGQRLLANTSPAVIGGLTSAAAYTFHLWPQCGTDTFLCNYDILQLTTMHPPVAMPYCHNFESIADWSYPDEWSRWNPDGTTCAATSYGGHDDTRSLHLVSSHSASVTAITPKLEPSSLCTDHLYLNFWYRIWSGQQATLIVGTTDDLSDTNSFTPYDTIILTSTSWQHHTSTLPRTALTTGRAAFRLMPDADILVDNLCIETCVAANVQVSDITQHSATITWDGYGVDTLLVEYGRQGFAQGTGTVVAITSSPYTITGLSASSDYNFIFRTVCSCPTASGSVYPAGGGTGGRTWWDGFHYTPYVWIDTTLYPGYSGWGIGYGWGSGGGIGSGGGLSVGAETQAELLATPYCEDFDTTALKTIPAGWRRIPGSTPGYPQTVRTPVLSGARSIDLYTTTGYSNHLALPPVANPSQLILAFNSYTPSSEPSERSYGVFTVGVMSDPDRGSTFVPLDTVVISQTNRWQQHFVDLSSLITHHPQLTTHNYIAFRFTPRHSSYHIYLDNIYLGSCAVTSASATVTNNGATLHYTTIGSANGVLVEDTNGYFANITVSPQLLPSLDPDGHYQLNIRAYSDIDTQSLCHLMPIVINPILTLPYCQNFESTNGTLPSGWTLLHTNDNAYPHIEQCTQHSDGELLFAPYNNSTGAEILLLPPMPDGDSIGGLYLQLDYRANTSSTYNYTYSYLDIGYLLDTNNYNTFQSLATLHNTSYTQHHTLQIPSAAASRLALRARSTSGTRNFHIDNLSLSRLPLPSSGSTSSPNNGYTSKHISWNTSTLSPYYRFEYGPAGFAPGSGTSALSDSASLTLTGLSPETDYDIYFIDSLGNYSCQPYRFLTSHASPLPYCEDFQQYSPYTIPNGWQRITYGSYPQLYNDHNTIHLDFYGYGTQVWILPEPLVDSIQRLSLNADYWFSTTSNKIEIGILLDPSDWSTFTPVDTISTSTTGRWINASTSFANYSGNGRFIALHYLNPSSGNYIHVDNISLQTIPPHSLSPVSATQICVTLDTSFATDFYIEIVPQGQTQGLGRTIHVNSNPFLISDLVPGQTYHLYPRADSLVHTCAQPVTITMPDQLELPYCEDFDTYGDCYNCRPQQWTYSTSNDDQNYTVDYQNWSLRFYSYYYNTHYVYASLPDFQIDDIRDLSIEMRYRFESSSSLAEFGVVRTPGDWDSFIPLDTLLAPSTNTWYTLRHNLRNYSGQYRFLTIRMRGNQYQYNYLYIDYLRIQSCPMPEITLSGYNTIKCSLDTTYSSADYWIHITDGDVLDSMIHADSNPFYITDLNATTSYTLTTLCDSAIETCLPATTITTGQLQMLPYCENFDSYGSGEASYPDGWEKIVNCGDDRLYTTSSNNWSLRFYSYYYSTCWPAAILPDMDIDSIRHLSMQIRFLLESSPSTVEIVVFDSPAAGASYTPIKTFTGLSSNTWYTENIDFSSYNGGSRFIGIRIQGNQYQYNYLYIDYTYLQDMPLVHFTLPEATTIAAVVDSAQAVDYWLHYTLSGSSDTTHVHVASSNYRLDNLAENSTYRLLATTDSTGTSCWPWESVTTTHLQTIPYCENFDSYSQSDILPTGWARYRANTGLPEPTIDGSHRLFFGNWCDRVESMVMLPELDIDNISDLNLQFDINCNNASIEELVVGVLDDRNDQTTFVGVDTIRVQASNTWYTVYTSLANYTGNGRFVAFKPLRPSGCMYIYIDNLVFDFCNTRATATLVNSNTIQIDGSTGFYAEYGPSGFEQGTGTIEYIDIVPYDITLNYETTYDLYFRCDTALTTCLPKQTITTLAPPLELSHCEDFESYSIGSMPQGWLKYRLPQEYGDNCEICNDQSHSSSKSLRMCSYYTDRHPYAVMTELDVDSLSKIAISFWMRNAHKDNFTLDLGTVSDPYDMSTFVPLRHFSNSANNTWQRQQAILSDAPNDARYLAFRFNSSINSWDWLYIDDLHIDTCGASDLQIAAIESESVTLQWNQSGSPSITLDIVPVGDAPRQISLVGTPPFTVDGLTPLTSYMIRFHSSCLGDQTSNYCTTDYLDSVRFFTPAGGTGCIDPTNLTADYVTCFTGSYRNPYAALSLVDSGAASPLSRHTVHFDPSERDPRTAGLLRTVPEGASASVRLGNWGTHKISNTEGGEAEAITYALYVDTMSFDLLIMKYAAVMQDPMHAASDQPRFRLELLDSTLNLIDPTCGAADFIANQNLGWNTVGSDDEMVLWKDWTTVGLDMTPYAGQTVFIRLTTYDCNEGSHFGYAYFTLDCMRKSMTAEGCGTVASNVFTAPSGFAYRWYSNQDNSTFSSAQSIDVASNNNITYFCDLSFVDNDACSFTMSAFAGTRFPLSLFDSVIIINNCQFQVSFNNHSTISMDGINPVGTGEGVETAWWNFGNGSTSNSYHASTVYTSPGTYTVTLISSIAGGVCTDTLQKDITLTLPPTNPRIVGPTDHCYGSPAETLTLLEAASWTVWTNDTIAVTPWADTTYTLLATDSNGCQHPLSHTIAVHPVYNDTLITAICDGSSFHFRNLDLTRNGIYTDSLSTTHHHCDSTVTLLLTVNPNTDTTILDTVNERLLPYSFNGQSFSDNVNNHIFHLTNSLGCDSTITYSLAVIWNDKVTHLDSTVCSNNLPITWNNIYMPDTGTYTLSLLAFHGEDSTVVMHLHSAPIYNDTVDHSICDNQQYSFEGATYSGSDAGLHSHLLHTVTYGCDSLRTLRLDVRPTTSGDTVADHCDQFSWYGTTYTASTDSPTHLSLNSLLCDSTTTLHLTIRYSSASVIEETIVENQLPYTFNGVTFTDSSDLTSITIPNAVGCDSTISYTLHVDWNTGSRLDSNICFNQLPVTWNGASFDTTVANTTVMRTVVIPSASGSDSTIIMRLHVRPVYNDTLDHSICDNQQYIFEGTTYNGSDAGLHSHLLLTDTYNCDSLRTLRLDVRPTTSGDTVADHCDQFSWYGTTYTASTDSHTHLSLNSLLCDSTTTLHLTIRYSSASVIEETIVENQLPYTFNGVTFTDSSDLSSITIPNAVGCDSTISYTLHVDWNTGSRLDSNICFNQLPITWNGASFDTTVANTTVMRTVVIPSASGSDSTIIMRLHVRPVYNDTLDHSICDNQQYTFEGATYNGSDAGLHSHLLHTVTYGCDSLRTLRLDVRPTTSGDTIADRCDHFSWYGTTYTASTNSPTHLSLNSLQCDSTTTLHLTIRYSTTSVIEETIVENQLPYTFNGVTFTDSSDLSSITIPNAVGCDSTISYTLHVDWNTGSRLDSNICFNQLPVIWNGASFDTTVANTTIMRTVVIPSASGSDSTIIMRLHVRPVYNDTLDHSICDNQQYTFEGSTYNGSDAGLHSHLLHTVTHGCDSLRTLRLDVRPTTTGDTIADHCDQFSWYGTTYTASTDSPTHLSLNSLLCDSTTTLHLTIRYSSASVIEETIVENQLPYTFNGVTFTDSSDLTSITIPNAVGCDSTISYTLHVDWNTGSRLDSNICFNQLPVIWNGASFDTTVVNTTVVRTVMIPSVTGSDSTIVMNLHVRPIYNDTVDHSICDNQQYTFEGATYNGSDAGLHSHLLHTVTYGCDSLRTLRLDVRPTTSGDTVADHCDQFSWYGTTYTASTDSPTHLSLNSLLCDSTTTLHLTIRYSTTSQVTDTIVQNQLPFTYHDSIFSDSLSHATVIFPNAVLCDSIVDYSLFVFWNVGTALYDTVCNDALPITWNGVTFDTTVSQSTTLTRSATFLTSEGADSVVVMHLTVHALYDHHTFADICDNQQYTFGDSTFSGQWSLNNNLWHVEHLDSLTSIHGCDSLSTLHLSVHHTYDHHFYDTLCTNHSYTWGTPQRQMFTPGAVSQNLHGSDSLASFTIADSPFPTDTSFTDLLASIHQCDSLSSLHLHLLPAYDLHFRDTICNSQWSTATNLWTAQNYPFMDNNFDTTGTYPFQLTTPQGCDSTRTLHLKVYPTYEQHLYDTIYDGDTYLFEGLSFDTTGIYPVSLDAVFGCDSIRILHLQRNRRTYLDTTLCQNQLPITWNTLTFSDGQGLRQGAVQTIADSIHLVGLNGIDSLVVMTLTVHDTSTTTLRIHACDSLVWQDNLTYTATTSTPSVTYSNLAQCDSVVHLDLTVDYTHHYTDRHTVCDSMQWINHLWYMRDTVGVVDTLLTVAGCDSVVTLDLTVHYSTSTALRDTICHNDTYTWHQFTVHSDHNALTEEFPLTDTLRTIHGCDSVVGMIVTKMALPSISFTSTPDCANLHYTISANATAPLHPGTDAEELPYLMWSSVPADNLLDGQEHQRTVDVLPRSTTEYILYADYHERPLCPLTASVTLRPVIVPQAQLKVNPESLGYNKMNFDAYDISREQWEKRTWYIDWNTQSETGPTLSGRADFDADSVIVALEVYNGQCFDTALRILPVNRVSLYAPNAITPDRDNNNRFEIITQGVLQGELYIYNREGLLVYYTPDYTRGWDGRNNDGSPCIQGNYVWKLVYRGADRPTSDEVEVGTVLIIH